MIREAAAWHRPDRRTEDKTLIAEHFYFQRQPSNSIILAHLDSNGLIHLFQEKLRLPLKDAEGKPINRDAALMLYHSQEARRHERAARHFISMKEEVEFKTGKGYVRKMVSGV